MSDLEAVKARLLDLARSNHRAQMRALMPVLDQLSRDGVSYASIAETLQSCGYTQKPNSVRQALYRWRKHAAASSSSVATPASVSAPKPTTNPEIQVPARPSVASKSDLVKLRKSTENIDLAALAELGRRA